MGNTSSKGVSISMLVSQGVVSVVNGPMVKKPPFRIGLWDPFQMATLINGGGPNHSQNGMILQVVVGFPSIVQKNRE